MNAIKKTKNNDAKVSHLKVVHNRKSSETNKLIDATWLFVQSALWNNREFTRKEASQFKELIAEHYQNNKSEQINFKNIIERICLAKRYVARRKGRYISKPIDWLNINYHKGLAGTAKWLTEVNEQRKTVPEYNQGIHTLANGLLKYVESPTMISFYQTRRKLIQQKQYDLLQIFYTTIINLQYLN